VATLVYFSVSGLLSQFQGVQGISMAYALTWWLLLTISILLLIRGKWHHLEKGNIHFIWQMFMSLCLTGIIVILGNSIFLGQIETLNWIGLLVRVMLVSGAGGLMFLLASARIFRMPEMDLLFGLIPFSRVTRRFRN